MLDKIKTELIKYGEIIGNRGFSPGISGNISAKFDNKIIITASGSANGFLSEEDFSILDENGTVVDGNTKPSTESFLHIEYYKQRPDIDCVFHVHSPYLTAFAAAGIPLDEMISPEIIYCFKKIPIAKYAMPGSQELVNNTSVFFKDYDIVLMENHGVVVGSKSIKQTYLHLELAEEYAKTLLFAKLLGGAKIISEKETKKILQLRNS